MLLQNFIIFVYTTNQTMRKIDLLLAEYGESHRNIINKFIHWICVPLIFWTILGFVSLIPSKSICFIYIGCISYVSFIVMALITIYYLRLSFLIGLLMILIMILMESFAYGLNTRFDQPWVIYLAVFVVTWILQFIGHKIEGKKPSFLKDLQFLLIGPIWLLSFILKKLGIRY
ncbi:DUF962 domain-containing protein [Chryseobacterium sp. Alg-005]